MNIDQEIIKIIKGVITVGKQDDFILDEKSCNEFVENEYTSADRQTLGKAFSKKARDKTIVKINGINYSIEFNNMFNKCGKCGYKGNANIAHYKITKEKRLNNYGRVRYDNKGPY